ncbi:DciA family protein [Streptomyces scabiei]|uniref:DciA family protein n=1 Tax=Streptomyces scabiei TaxID=1930 RepID=UPI0029BC0E1B|nr:DciA family protein [Streptomyces scabiei]MDX3165969.1 DciA family protein [Streptomyces scabiei]
MTTDIPPASGADLARIALRQAKEAARRQGAQQAPKPKRTVRHRRYDGRDPLALGSIWKQWLVDNGWEEAADGGSLLNQWPSIIGEERAAHWHAVAYDETTKTLTVVCESDSWARMLSLVSRQLCDDVNRAVKPGTLAAIKVRKGVHRPAPGSRQAVAEPASPPPTRSQPPGTQPTSEYSRIRDRLREEKVQRDAAESESYIPLTRMRIQEDPDEHVEAQYLQQSIAEDAARKADSHTRALRYARQQRAAANRASTPSPPRQPKDAG